jgi:uncharacterized protein YqeY
MLTAALKNERIQKRGDLDEEDLIAVVGREVKRRREAAEQYRSAGAEDRAAAEETEAEALAVYLPEPLSDEELDRLIDEVVAETNAVTKKDMGRVMGVLMPRVKGRVDGRIVQQKVMGRLA